MFTTLHIQVNCVFTFIISVYIIKKENKRYPIKNGEKAEYMIENEAIETILMTIIAHSGAARGSAFEALSAAKKGEAEKSLTLIEQANGALREAHNSHKALLKMDADGEIEKIDMLIVHAQDHLMMSTLASELIAEIVEIRNILGKME